MNLSFFRVHRNGAKNILYKKDGRFVILLVKYFSGIGGATVPDIYCWCNIVHLHILFRVRTADGAQSTHFGILLPPFQKSRNA